MSDITTIDIPVLAVDGPSGSGKGTISQSVAKALGWHFLDSGALYRLVAVAADKRGIELDDVDALADVARTMNVRFDVDETGAEQVYLDDNDVTAEIRTETCGTRASQVAPLSPVRAALAQLQREFRREPGLVADGRDMGTVIFPDAPLKIYLTASAEERASRRHKQLKEKGIDVSLAALSSEIEERDRRDAERQVAPLKPAADAVVLDTTEMSIVEVIDRVLDLARQRLDD